ncbi:MAG: 2OG-Fe(II) oxygenase [Gammaproteobacteria bacterium]|nr:2OG-Fe(II) oxygenase [Gammaproteobacteria bacterium]
MSGRSLRGVVAAPVVAGADSLREAFLGARPFRHCVVDGFLEPAFAASLLAQFPDFEQGHFLNEDGVAGGKSTVERIRALGDAFAALDDCVRSPDFLALVGHVTGIDDLLYDPEYFGGGTHENRDGQSLDAHIDFNMHPTTGWHRRLNLIVYLNHGWREEWGGTLQLHRDPRDPATDEVTSIAPLFNRCVVFETTEQSWHGFPPIRLPPGQASTSRKSVALYFYTRQRPARELASRHSTVYVDRPLPDHLRPGHVLSDGDVAELRELLARRDAHSRRLYAELGTLQAELDRGFAGRVFAAARRVRARLRR